MMKSKDVSTAVALLINGYLRANTADERGADEHLRDCLVAIRQEASDWAENLVGDDAWASAVPAGDLEVLLHAAGGEVPRTPLNLVTAVTTLLREAVDLSGPAEVIRMARQQGVILQTGER